MLDFQSIEALLSRHREALQTPVRRFDIGGTPFDLNRRRALMGVINLSPDSWYTESVCTTPEAAIARGRALAAEGADIVDIGAESTLPDAERVDAQGQIERLEPVVRALAGAGVRVSVESYHPEVLEAGARAGACVFNLTGRGTTDDVLRLARRHDAAVIHCYVQGETVRDVQAFQFFEDTMGAIEGYFRERLARAEALGVHRNIVDPGLGFYYRNLNDSAQRVSYQLHTFLSTPRLNRLGYPTLNILPHAPEAFGEAHRRAAEPFFAVLALLGTHVVRTHELATVARIRTALELYQAG